MKLLEEAGVDFSRVNYMVEPLGRDQLQKLLGKARLSPRDVLRKREPLYRELGLGRDSVSNAQILSALVEHPDLLERPIVERGSRAVLGRPIENVYALL